MHGNLKRLLYYILIVDQNLLRWLSYEKIMMQLHAAADVQHSDHFAAYLINLDYKDKSAYNLVHGGHLR